MQPGFFEFDDLNDKLDQHNDPLVKINELVDWAAFRRALSKIRMPRSSNKGCPRSDTLPMFKMIFLRHDYSLSFKQVEYPVLDRLSFRRFLGLSLEDPVPDANAVRKYEELLVQKNSPMNCFTACSRKSKPRVIALRAVKSSMPPWLKTPEEKPKSSSRKRLAKHKNNQTRTMTPHRRHWRVLRPPAGMRPGRSNQPMPTNLILMNI